MNASGLLSARENVRNPTDETAERLQILSVCQTLPTPDRPGAGIFVLNRLRAMAGFADVKIMQPVPYFPGVRAIPDWVSRSPSHTIEDTKIQHRPTFYLPGIFKSLDGRWFERTVYEWVARQRVREGVNIIDAHFGYPDGVACVRAARRLGLPVFVTIRGLETDCLKRPLVRGQLLKALNSATGCISVSYSLRDLLVDSGLRSDHVTVIPNAIDREVFTPGDRYIARAKLGLPASGRIIVSVGHLISGKRHHVLVRAMKALAERHGDATLAIIGGPAYEARYPGEIRKMTEALGLSDRVRLVGRVAPREVAEWLRAADVFALMTAREGCCNSVLEALASGLPVVTTPVGDNPQFVQNGRNGFLVPVDDVDAAAQALQRALQASWDPRQISAELQVGTWTDTAALVLKFMKTRLAIGGRARSQ